MKHTVVIAFLALLAGACGAGTKATTTAPVSTTTTAPLAATTTQTNTANSQATAPTSTTLGSTQTTATTEAWTEFVVGVTGGSVDRVETFKASLGDRVRLVVTADVSDEVHLHGYDLAADVAPGTEAIIDFRAEIPGVFEVELEDAGVLIAELVVSP